LNGTARECGAGQSAGCEEPIRVTLEIGGYAVKALSTLIVLVLGYAVWALLKPYIGVGGLLVGAGVAFVVRPLVFALLGIRDRESG